MKTANASSAGRYNPATSSRFTCSRCTPLLAAQLAAAKMQNDALKKVVEKKKGKLLASAKYKTKMRGYLESIGAVDKLITAQTASMAKAKTMSSAIVRR